MRNIMMFYGLHQDIKHTILFTHEDDPDARKRRGGIAQAAAQASWDDDEGAHQ
jgi:hypothetical protein